MAILIWCTKKVIILGTRDFFGNASRWFLSHPSNSSISDRDGNWTIEIKKHHGLVARPGSKLVNEFCRVFCERLIFVAAIQGGNRRATNSTQDARNRFVFSLALTSKARPMPRHVQPLAIQTNWAPNNSRLDHRNTASERPAISGRAPCSRWYFRWKTDLDASATTLRDSRHLIALPSGRVSSFAERNWQ